MRKRKSAAKNGVAADGVNTKAKPATYPGLACGIIIGFILGVAVTWIVAVHKPRKMSYSNTSASLVNATHQSAFFSPKMVSVVPRAVAQPLDARTRRRLAETYFNKAQGFDPEKGEGNIAWLYLLAAHSMDIEDYHYLEQLVNNYQSLGMVDIALDEIYQTIEHQKDRPGLLHPAYSLLQTLKRKHPKAWEKYHKLRESLKADAVSLPRVEVLLPFSTLVGQWDLTGGKSGMERLHQDFYDATIKAYHALRDRISSVDRNIPDDTALNHKFFNWQMEVLRQTGEYWSGYTALPLFHSLLQSMRAAAAELLVMHGYTHEQARRKAAHRCVFWTSVHTESSVHEAHNTVDSLVGGVYYVSVPPNSGHLQLLDTRGLHPLGVNEARRMRRENVQQPPFHRTVDVTPREGLLVLFPGWLTHQVLQSKRLSIGSSNRKYRVSVSINLKGEWHDTSDLTLVLKEYKE